jgi:predicted GNAT family acetyltransferase
MSLAIEHLADRGRFQAVVDGEAAFTEYRSAGGELTILHTEVPAQLGGRGIAAALVQAVLAHARGAGLTVRPLCDYARGYMERHPETSDLRAA